MHVHINVEITLEVVVVDLCVVVLRYNVAFVMYSRRPHASVSQNTLALTWCCTYIRRAYTGSVYHRNRSLKAKKQHATC